MPLDFLSLEIGTFRTCNLVPRVHVYGLIFTVACYCNTVILFQAEGVSSLSRWTFFSSLGEEGGCTLLLTMKAEYIDPFLFV